MMRWSSKRSLSSAVACLLALATAGCESSETIAPEGATIDLSASPAQILLSDGVQVSPVTILATVRSSIGVPLEGQDVRFTTTRGTLKDPRTGDPAVGVPVETDGDGNAKVELTGATTSVTITAASGKASDTLNITAASREIAQILFSVTPTSFDSCSDKINMTARVVDSDGMPVENVSISFASISTGAPSLSFTNNPELTDPSGEVKSEMSFSNQTECQNKCGKDMSGNDQDCSFTIQAAIPGTSFTSDPVDITDDVSN